MSVPPPPTNGRRAYPASVPARFLPTHPVQGKDLWLQGMITLETLYVEYRADVHVFDHLVHERFSYHVSGVRTLTGKAGEGKGREGRLSAGEGAGSARSFLDLH